MCFPFKIKSLFHFSSKEPLLSRIQSLQSAPIETITIKGYSVTLFMKCTFLWDIRSLNLLTLFSYLKRKVIYEQSIVFFFKYLIFFYNLKWYHLDVTLKLTWIIDEINENILYRSASHRTGWTELKIFQTSANLFATFIKTCHYIAYTGLVGLCSVYTYRTFAGE